MPATRQEGVRGRLSKRLKHGSADVTWRGIDLFLSLTTQINRAYSD